jgi:hypothetical protein
LARIYAALAPSKVDIILGFEFERFSDALFQKQKVLSLFGAAHQINHFAHPSKIKEKYQARL